MTSITASQDRNLRTGSRLTGIGAAALIGYAVVFFVLNSICLATAIFVVGALLALRAIAPGRQ